jgi:predicted PurR-regulated permease PerM
MQKHLLYMMAFSFLLSFIPAQLSAETNDLIKDKTTKNESAEAKVLLTRLDQIKAMDKSKLSSQEKKQLRKEVRTLKTNLATINGGVYLSVGAIIIIILLLILLL